MASGQTDDPAQDQGGMSQEMAVSLSPKRRKNTYVPQPPTAEPTAELSQQVRMADSKMDLKRLSGYLKERNQVLTNTANKKQKRLASPRHNKSTRVGSPLGGGRSRSPGARAGLDDNSGNNAAQPQQAFVFQLHGKTSEDPDFDSELELPLPSLENLLDEADTHNVRSAIQAQAADPAVRASAAADLFGDGVVGGSSSSGAGLGDDTERNVNFPAEDPGEEETAGFQLTLDIKLPI